MYPPLRKGCQGELPSRGRADLGGRRALVAPPGAVHRRDRVGGGAGGVRSSGNASAGPAGSLSRAPGTSPPERWEGQGERGPDEGRLP